MLEKLTNAIRSIAHSDQIQEASHMLLGIYAGYCAETTNDKDTQEILNLGACLLAISGLANLYLSSSNRSLRLGILHIGSVISFLAGRYVASNIQLAQEIYDYYNQRNDALFTLNHLREKVENLTHYAHSLY